VAISGVTTGRSLAQLAALAGIAAPIVYGLTVVIGGASTAGYDPIRDSISSLTEAGRQDIFAIQGGFLLYNCLVGVFAIGLGALQLQRAWRAVFGLYLLTAACGLLMWPFAQDPPGVVSASGMLHIALASVESLSSITILAICLWRCLKAGRLPLTLAAGACLVATVAFGAAAAVATGMGLPNMGLFERITIGSFELWTLVLATVEMGHPVLLAPGSGKS